MTVLYKMKTSEAPVRNKRPLSNVEDKNGKVPWFEVFYEFRLEH